MWDLPGPGLEPVSPALAGRFSTTAPPGKPPTCWLLTVVAEESRAPTVSLYHNTDEMISVHIIRTRHMLLAAEPANAAGPRPLLLQPVSSSGVDNGFVFSFA